MATSRGPHFNLCDLNRISNFSWRCNLSYEILFVALEQNWEGLDYVSQNEQVEFGGLDIMDIVLAIYSTLGQNCGSVMPWLNHKIKMIQNQKEIWIHITRDPHFPILSQSKYVNDCSLKVPIKAHMIKCYAFYLLYLRVVLFVGCLFGKYVGMHFFLSTQGKYTFVKKFTVNLVQSCDLTSVWIIALLIVEMLKSGILTRFVK